MEGLKKDLKESLANNNYQRCIEILNELITIKLLENIRRTNTEYNYSTFEDLYKEASKNLDDNYRQILSKLDYINHQEFDDFTEIQLLIDLYENL